MNTELNSDGFDNFDEDAIVESMETEYTPIPEGTWQATVQEAQRATQRTKNGMREVIKVKYRITDPNLPEEFIVNGEGPVMNDTIWLDLDSQGRWAVGKNLNLGLGRFRHATGTEDPMTARQILEKSFGASVQLEIVHEPRQDDPTAMMARIKKLLPA